MDSILVVLVMLEGLQKLVVLGEGLTTSLGHVESAILHLLTPECDRLLPLIAYICADQLPQLLVACYLPTILETQ
jgi:hypothetical protein